MLWTRIVDWNLAGWRGYAVATVLVVVLGLLRVALTPVVGDSVPYALFVPAILVVPLGAGFLAGLYTALISVLFGWFFILDGLSLAAKTTATLVLLGPILVLVAGMAWLRQGLELANDARREAERERDRAQLLAREINHRVKNLFAVIGSIVALAGRDAPEARGVLGGLKDRIGALAAAHTASQGEFDGDVVSLDRIVETVLAPYGREGSEGSSVETDGPHVPLRFEAVTPMGLILHELATNATKHGALSVPTGRVRVRWSHPAEGRVRLEWTETGGPPIAKKPAAGGFGSLLLQQAVKQLGATVRRHWPPEGFRMTLEFPLDRADEEGA